MTARTGAELGAEAARRLRRWGRHECEIEPGLTDAEFARVEDEFEFEFADDHRAFLAAGLPVSVPYDDPPGVLRAWPEPWLDWRDGDREALRERLDWPMVCVENYIEHHNLWHAEFGERPESLADAIAVARSTMAKLPVLVPVFAHRFLPAGRGSHSHPVMSVFHTDSIYYGADLADWVGREFLPEHDDETALGFAVEIPDATVRFWKDLL
ncbi:hypothetical protein GCM10009839_77930 [Catenulispora yoronensis]|uniref:SMI1/KNR4 family protein n=1 Tax=Catenulispora yoronensis TaxID=450799 RepID=A0ABN2VB72_9ACTN